MYSFWTKHGIALRSFGTFALSDYSFESSQAVQTSLTSTEDVPVTLFVRFYYLKTVKRSVPSIADILFNGVSNHNFWIVTDWTSQFDVISDRRQTFQLDVVVLRLDFRVQRESRRSCHTTSYICSSISFMFHLISTLVVLSPIEVYRVESSSGLESPQRQAGW